MIGLPPSEEGLSHVTLIDLVVTSDTRGRSGADGTAVREWNVSGFKSFAQNSIIKF